MFGNTLARGGGNERQWGNQKVDFPKNPSKSVGLLGKPEEISSWLMVTL